MTKAESSNTVKVHYKGSLEDGSVFDESFGKEPLEFTLGAGQLIPGFEKAVLGLKIGETVTTHIPAKEAYGERNEQLEMDVERTNLPPEIEPVSGMPLHLNQPDGSAVPVTITKVTDTHITIDANHPLSGKDLTFEIQLVEIVG